MVTESGLQIPSSREDSAGIWFAGQDPLMDGYWLTAFDLITTKPGSSTYLTCMINVPFAHKLLKASLSTEDIDNLGALTVDLMQADPGDAKAGTSVDQLDDTEMASTTDTAEQLDFTISGSDLDPTSAGRRYWLKIIGDNAGDFVEAPALSIFVEPVVRMPGNDSYLTCYINVPFAHRLLKASLSVDDIDNSGTLTCDLMQLDPGDAKAGTSVDQLDDTAMAATANVGSQLAFTISDADKQATAAGRRYFLKFTGTNIADRVEAPALSLLVEPVTRSRL